MTKRSLLPFLLILIALLLTSCRNGGNIKGKPVDANNLPDIVGLYAVNGVDSGGAGYSGTLKVEKGDAGGYKLHWIVTGAIQEGEGVIDGNQLKAKWRNIEGVAMTHGTITYTITTLGELDGKRSIDDFEGEGWEHCFPNDEKWGKFKLGH